ncbi:carotenoid isomerooxygenase [Anoplophora glabripennis]|uniref:carotenoid isomerooxygenase n=1 Tax=Anoplophora glabripennis TaxID=217634 RepID=UPI000C759AEF|nr:carotenoid isomerooxygenase [Anoplophora glabripennis]
MHKFREMENRKGPSGQTSPIFTWSPLPQRKQMSFIKREKISSPSNKETKLYPNCDANVWLRSCEEEVIGPLQGKITGDIPNWLNGSLIRNGPGLLKVGDHEFAHLFDSLALLHRFGIKNGEVTYQCRFLRSETFKQMFTAKRIVTTQFGTKSVPDPCHTIFQRIAAMFNVGPLDNSMISVYPFGDELYAFGETPIIHKVNPESLNTEDAVDVRNYISIVNHTSHPHVMQDGAVYNIGISLYTTGPHHIIICFPKKSKCGGKTMFENARIVASVPARWPFHPSYMHTFGVTENYFIIVEQPLSISVPSALKTKLQNEPLIGCLKWYQDEYTQFNVVSKTLGILSYKFFAKAFFYLHIINQYETDNYIVIDICVYRDPGMLECMYIDSMKSMQQNPDYAKMFRGRPARFVLPLKPDPMEADIGKNLVSLENCSAKAYYLPTGDILVVPERICNLGCETPRINYENSLGKPYRYFYAISSDVDRANPGTIVKIDAQTKTAQTWCEENCYPSEPIFVASPNSKFEDDGIILAAMVWGGEDANHAGLLILDAKTFKEIGRAEFITPGPVPKCLHGWFLPKGKTEIEN